MKQKGAPRRWLAMRRVKKRPAKASCTKWCQGRSKDKPCIFSTQKRLSAARTSSGYTQCLICSGERLRKSKVDQIAKSYNKLRKKAPRWLIQEACFELTRQQLLTLLHKRNYCLGPRFGEGECKQSNKNNATEAWGDNMPDSMPAPAHPGCNRCMRCCAQCWQPWKKYVRDSLHEDVTENLEEWGIDIAIEEGPAAGNPLRGKTKEEVQQICEAYAKAEKARQEDGESEDDDTQGQKAYLLEEIAMWVGEDPPAKSALPYVRRPRVQELGKKRKEAAAEKKLTLASVFASWNGAGLAELAKTAALADDAAKRCVLGGAVVGQVHSVVQKMPPSLLKRYKLDKTQWGDGARSMCLNEWRFVSKKLLQLISDGGKHLDINASMADQDAARQRDEGASLATTRFLEMRRKTFITMRMSDAQELEAACSRMRSESSSDEACQECA